jgi:hypothetical protein
MARNLLPLLGALALASCGLSAPNAAAAPPLGSPAPLPSQTQQFQAQPSQALVGTWSATVNWNLPSGLLITTTFMSNGGIQSTTQNHMGMSFTLMGTYQFNAAQGTLSYKWSDFSPKQTCVGGFCTPAQPPVPMGVATTSNGASTTYVRTNAAGFPAP